MKTIRSFLPLLLSVLILTPSAHAASYTRFWRGFARADLSESAFVRSLNEGLLPATGALAQTPVGILSYFPVVLPTALVKRGFPAEVALLEYADESAYAAYRATPAGKAYGDLHWNSFDRERSGSRVPSLPLAGSGLMIDQAYEFRNSPTLDAVHPIWFRVITRSPGTDDATYLSSIARHVDHLLRTGPTFLTLTIERNAVLEYVAWPTARQANAGHVTAVDRGNWSGSNRILDPLIEVTGRLEFETILRPGRTIAPGQGVRYPIPH